MARQELHRRGCGPPLKQIRPSLSPSMPALLHTLLCGRNKATEMRYPMQNWNRKCLSRTHQQWAKPGFHLRTEGDYGLMLSSPFRRLPCGPTDGSYWAKQEPWADRITLWKFMGMRITMHRRTLEITDYSWYHSCCLSISLRKKKPKKIMKVYEKHLKLLCWNPEGLQLRKANHQVPI